MARTPSSSKSSQSQHAQTKTPQSKLRLHLGSAKTAHPSPNPNSNLLAKETPLPDHPVEVIGRIRDFPDRKDNPVPVLHINPDYHRIVRVRADFGYRDFSLDGVSLSEEEDLEGFYNKFVGSRINGVKLGDKCTVMMYGPTGSGKSHTMFGCSKFPGIVYRSLKDILGEGGEEDGVNPKLGTFVQVTVLEIYNEEIYDLLSSNGNGGFGLGWSKGIASKVRLEVVGKKAKNATFISGNEAGKISKEIQKVEKRRIVKSTLCNERSSRSHCMIILDVPTVGGRLMLVDMAGSENIEQAGQVGFEAKLQTSKINQGNIALKRVVESIANGDSHVPFRDSKLTMLLQDSFEDDKSKILMILCASPDPKEIHKTISTLEYGAKAKCIVRGPHTPNKKISSEDISLGLRIAAMDQFIYKLQMENKQREKECNEAQKQLSKKAEEVAQLRAKIELIEGKGSGSNEEEIDLKVSERTRFLKSELEWKLKECQKMANEYVDLGRKKMEEKMLQQQKEVEMLRRRLEEIESEIYHSRDGNSDESGSRNVDGNRFAKRLLEFYADGDPGMVKSMDLDMGNQDSFVHDVKYLVACQTSNIDNKGFVNYPQLNTLKDDDNCDVLAPKYGSQVNLSTVFEEEVDEEEGCKENSEVEEVKKEVIEEKTVYSSEVTDASGHCINFSIGSQPRTDFAATPDLSSRNSENVDYRSQNTASSRRMRIQNIFTLCGNYRELSQHISTPMPSKKGSEIRDPRSSPVRTIREDLFSDENLPPQKSHLPSEPFPVVKPANEKKPTETPTRNQLTVEVAALDIKEKNNPNDGNSIEVYVKWEASKENQGKFITTLRIAKDSSLYDLRKLIESYLDADSQGFTFLTLGNPTGAPVPKEKEATIQASKLPICNNQVLGHFACLRSVMGVPQPDHIPLSPVDNKLPLTPISRFTQHGDCLSQKLAPNFSSNPCITVQRHQW